MHAGAPLILRAPLNLVASCTTHHKAASERDEHIALRGDDRVAGDVGAAAPDIAAEFSQRKSSKPRIWKAIAGGRCCPARTAGNEIDGIGVTLLFGTTAIRDAPDRYRTHAGSPR
jgi:hypothetical protein